MTAKRALLSVFRKEGIVDLARGLTDSGGASEAVEIYDEILGAARKAFGPEHYLVATFEGGLGASLLELGRFAEAEAELLKSHDRLNETFGPENRRTLAARQRLLELYVAWGRSEAADRYR
jgi:tetratricopeptide (TPR) repeat protein